MRSDREDPILLLSKESKKTSTSLKSHSASCQIKIIGDSGIGKTSLVMRLAHDRFAENSYIATLGSDVATTNIDINEKTIKITVHDGTARNKLKNPDHYPGSIDAVLIAFDFTSRESFSNVKGWLNDVKTWLESSSRNKNAIILLVATKSDLPNREVASKESNTILKNSPIKIDGYIETSAKTSENVMELFQITVKLILENRLALNPPSPKSTEKKITLDQFKAAYKEKYKSEFFKNPLSKMNWNVDSISTLEEIEKYAAENPDSRTATVLTQLKK